MKATETIQQPTAEAYSDRRGVMFVTNLPRLFPDISIDECDTMGKLRDDGVFARLKERLLFPESYTIVGVFLDLKQHYGRDWLILIESPDLPSASEFAWEDIEYPRIDPVYCQTFNEETGKYDPHLVEIKVHAQRTVPIKGGMNWLARAVVGDLAKERRK